MAAGLTACLMALAALGAAPPRQALRPVELEPLKWAMPTAVTLSPDGATLAAIANSVIVDSALPHRIVRWRTDTGKMVGQTAVKIGLLFALTYTHDGKALVGLIKGGGEEMPAPVLTMWEPDGKLLGGATPRDFKWEKDYRLFPTDDGQVYWFNGSKLSGCIVEPGGARRVFHRSPRVQGLYPGAVSNSGNLWAYLRGQDVDLFEVEGRKRLRSFVGARGRVRAACFRPDGKQLACVSHRLDDDEVSHTAVRVWSVSDGKLMWKLSPRPGLQGMHVAMSSGGLVAVVGEDDDGLTFLRVYDGAGREVARSVLGPKAGRPTSVMFSRDGKLLVLGLTRAVRLWRVSAKGWG